MDSTIIAAIIGAVATLIAALISISFLKRKKKQLPTDSVKKSQAFRLGFNLSFIQYAVNMQEKGIVLPNQDELYEKELLRCRTIALSIGIKQPSTIEPKHVVNEMQILLEAFALEIRECFRLGMVIGMTYFAAVNHISALGSLKKPIDSEMLLIPQNTINQIKKEKIHEKCNINEKMLKEIDSFWNEVINSAKAGTTNPSEDEKSMRNLIDKFCGKIENA